MVDQNLSETIIDNIVTLPTIPVILSELNAAIANADSSASDIATIISRDPPTAMKVLRLANSAYYGLRNKVMTINHAVTMLGFNIIRNLVTTATVFDISTDGNIEGLFDKEQFWRHSLGVGVGARALAREGFGKTGKQTDEFFICGLLHDLGKIIFGQYLQPKFAEALRMSRDNSVPLFEAEKSSIGCTHAEVGGLLAKRWNLSDEIISAVTYHHAPTEASDGALKYAATVHVADIIARENGIGSGGGNDPEVDSETLKVLGLDEERIPALLEEIDKSLSQQELAK